MAYATITVTNGTEVKKVPLGFSWTVFFFGPWPAFFRQDWIAGVVLFVLTIITYGIGPMIAAFIYNDYYAKSLFKKGYKINSLPAGITEAMVKEQLNFVKFPYEE
jgi:hypothetical protein